MGRCTAFPSSSRTTSRPAIGCRPPPDRWRWPASPAPRDAFVVARLRAAGVVLLGKTNLSEWANFRDRHSTSGWTARGGQTKNPYALDRSPSGSSSGSGAATAANLAAASVGTETDGSIVSPSSVNGLVGIKPTHGLLSRTGIVPISPDTRHAGTDDTDGRRCRSAARARWWASIPMTRPPETANRAACATTPGLSIPAALKGARIGVVRSRLFGYSAASDRLAEAAIAQMKQQGAVIVDPADIATLGSFEEDEMTIMQYEFGPSLKQYFAWLGPAAPVRSLEDVIAFNESHRGAGDAVLRAGPDDDVARRKDR